MARKPVMVVDDDTHIREALREVLEDEGYAVVGFANGREALEHLKAPRDGAPGLILLDLMMPVMNGWQFRQAQLEDPSLADIPVAVISADGGLIRQAASMNATARLRKPIELDELLETVGQYC
ncbi:MAG TPA: response regulator [Myxococcaceae bacterium]|nr:response regulator [Myxococcaceae bacterium]